VPPLDIRVLERPPKKRRISQEPGADLQIGPQVEARLAQARERTRWQRRIDEDRHDGTLEES
jgi:hypothetical protein